MPHLRKTAEVFMALYVSGFGAYVAAYAVAGRNSLAWSGLEITEALCFAYACMITATVHAVGIWLNGDRHWSPYLRLVGLLFGSALFIFLAWLGSVRVNTAGFTYLWVGMGFLAALRTAVIDCVLSWRGRYGNIRT